MQYSNIKDKLNDRTYIAEGKEAKCYDAYGKVIKIFHKERKSGLEMMSQEGLKKLSTLKLKHFNVPIDFVYDDEGNIIGYVEEKLEFEEANFNKYDINYTLNMLNEIKDDIRLLSDNGYQIDDLFYNYSFSLEGGLKFFDLTSYKYVDVKNDYLRDFYYKKNVGVFNTFFIGLVLFDAFKYGSDNEYTKIYKANEYINNNIKDEFIGDYLSKNIADLAGDFQLK